MRARRLSLFHSKVEKFSSCWATPKGRNEQDKEGDQEHGAKPSQQATDKEKDTIQESVLCPATDILTNRWVHNPDLFKRDGFRFRS
jgi:hypothetical protein